MMEVMIALVALTAMEIVLGIDNIVFIAILAGRLPKSQQAQARKLGLLAALFTRVLLLFSLSLILKLTDPLFSLSGIGIPLALIPENVDDVSVRDLILLVGGLFLIAKSVSEIHHKIDGHGEEQAAGKAASFSGVILQIAVLDIVFSLDSVITAIGMADQLWVMITAVVLSIGVMIAFAGTVSAFIDKHPTLKVLALSFLILIGVMLVAEGIGTHINKGYIYFAMAFALGVESVNLKVRSNTPDAGAAESVE